MNGRSAQLPTIYTRGYAIELEPGERVWVLGQGEIVAFDL